MHSVKFPQFENSLAIRKVLSDPGVNLEPFLIHFRLWTWISLRGSLRVVSYIIVPFWFPAIELNHARVKGLELETLTNLVTCFIPNRTMMLAPAPSPMPMQHLIRSWSRTAIRSSPIIWKKNRRSLIKHRSIEQESVIARKQPKLLFVWSVAETAGTNAVKIIWWSYCFWHLIKGLIGSEVKRSLSQYEHLGIAENLLLDRVLIPTTPIREALRLWISSLGGA